jgi:hypothetical protein
MVIGERVVRSVYINGIRMTREKNIVCIVNLIKGMWGNKMKYVYLNGAIALFGYRKGFSPIIALKHPKQTVKQFIRWFQRKSNKKVYMAKIVEEKVFNISK